MKHSICNRYTYTPNWNKNAIGFNYALCRGRMVIGNTIFQQKALVERVDLGRSGLGTPRRTLSRMEEHIISLANNNKNNNTINIDNKIIFL